MKSKNQRRVINVPKEQFDTIKAYCDARTLDMPKWVVKNSLEKIPNINQEDDFLSLLEDDSSIKFKTYENVEPRFRFTKEFICNVLFPDTDHAAWSVEKMPEYKCFHIKEIVTSSPFSKPTTYYGVGDYAFVAIQNAYKDLCDSIEWCIEFDHKTKLPYWVYRLFTNDKSYYET
jgi:hypothetical protein